MANGLLKLALILVAVALNQPLHADSFSGYTQFEAVSVNGSIWLHCQDGTSNEARFVDCHEQILEPGEYAYFQTDAGLDADGVEVQSTWENGKVRKKTSGYDPETGKSASRMNLWIETVFQRALLDMGTNKISYVVTKDKQPVKAGAFDVTVTEGQARTCRSGSRWSNSMHDCQFPDNACRQYFSENNYCQ